MIAYRDPLTGLPNQVFFEARLVEAIRWARSTHAGLALLYLDLDRFKDVNEMLGQGASDLLLCQAASRMSRVLSTRQVLARLADDEFGVLLEGAGGLVDAAEVARRLLDQCREPYLVDCIQVRLTASIGISLYPSDAEDPATLVKRADSAMFRAKIAGRNRSHPPCDIATSPHERR